MDTNQIMSVIFLVAVLILILPTFLSTNNKLKEFLKNLSIWAIITLVIVVIMYYISGWKKSIYQSLGVWGGWVSSLSSLQKEIKILD